MNIRLLPIAFAIGATIAAIDPAAAQWTSPSEQYYLPARHNWVFRAEHVVADRLFNAFDYGHAILYEELWRSPGGPVTALEDEQYAFITRTLLVNPPRLPLEEAAIAPEYGRLVPEARLMFEWAHVLHRQIYDVLADNRLSEADRDREVARLVAYYRTQPDLAFSARPKGMTLMEGQPYSLAFRQRFPKFNGLIWAYHWLQVGLYDALLAGRTADERSTLVTAAVARFRQMLHDAPRSMPYQMPMTPGVAPEFTRRYPEAAAIFDNLHGMHDVISDILANDNVPRDRKRAEILIAARRYRDDTTDVMTREAWVAMAEGMGIENQGGRTVGLLVAPQRPTVELGAPMPPSVAGADPHAGHRMPADTVTRIADSLSRGVPDAAARQRLVDALFALLDDETIRRRVASDSVLRKVLLDLLPLIPEEHQDHFAGLLKPPSTESPHSSLLTPHFIQYQRPLDRDGRIE